MEEEGYQHQFEAAFESEGGQTQQPEDPHSQVRIADTAKVLGVPSVLLETPDVREYLGFHNELGDIRGFIEETTTKLAIVEPDEAYIPPTHLLTPDGRTLFYARGKKRNLTPGIEHVLSENYDHTLPYISLAQMLIEEGVDVRTITPDVLKQTLNPALSHMELYIEDEPSDYDIQPFGWINGGYVSEYYDTRVEPHNLAYERTHKETIRQREAQDENLRYFLVASVPDTKGFVPHGPWVYAPRMHEYATAATKLTHAIDGLRRAGDTSAKESEQYMLEDEQRLDRITAVISLANETLWEGINGHHTRPLKFIQNLNYILDPYHVHVDVKPIDINAHLEDHETSTDIRRRMLDWQDKQNDKKE
jgi:hypothetical protein